MTSSTIILNPLQNLWGRLISLNPDTKSDIRFPINENHLNEYTFDDKWKIYQTQDGTITKIINCSDVYLKVDETLLEKNQEQVLNGAETITFDDQENDYVFVLMKDEPKNELKRERDEDHILQDLNDLEKKPKVEEEVHEDYTQTLQDLNDLEKKAKVEEEDDALTEPIVCKLSEIQMNEVSLNESTTLEDSPDNQRREKKTPKAGEKTSSQDNSSNEYVYEGELKKGKTHGKGFLKFKRETHHTKGDPWKKKNNKKQGNKVTGKGKNVVRKGRIEYPNGDIYEGDIKDFKCHGKGTLVLENGDTYEGKWVKDVLKSKGIIHYADGKKFEGKIDQLMRQGKGTLTLENGVVLNGTWIDDVIQPHVKIHYDIGGLYDGTINQETLLREGEGKLKFDDGDFYEGEFMKECFEGKGIYKWENGDVYDGNWKGGKRDGKGIIKYANRDRFEGHWKKGKREGKGKIFEKNGDVIEGTWVKDVLQMPVTIKYVNGEKYKGDLAKKDLKRHGKGVLTYHNGDVYDGKWKNDQKHGKGKMTFGNGLTYEGRWKDDERSGEGVFSDHGLVLQGKWH